MMNSLNLRVSSVKTGENIKKNAEMRTSLMCLPEKYLRKKPENFIVIFLKASTIPEQVIAVKNIHKNKEMQFEGGIQFLTDLYFNGPLKHPVRCQISKLLQNSQHIKSEIETSLESSMKTLLLLSPDQMCNSSNLNIVITSISGCFDNFPQGLRALEKNLSGVLQFIYDSLKNYLLELNYQSSPSGKNELYLFIHNSIRVILSCVQEFSAIISCKYRDHFKRFNEISKVVMQNVDIPMDTKRNAGILAAYFARIFESSLLHAYYTSRGSDEIIAEENMSLELCLCAGVINTLIFSDFCTYAKETKMIVEKIIKMTNINSTEPNMLLLGTRCLFQMSRNCLSFKSLSDNCLLEMKEISRILMDFCLIYLENYMDSVRHMCRDLLRNIIKLEVKFELDELLNEMFETCNSDCMAISMKCIIFSATSEVLGSMLVLQHNPNIFDGLFMEQLGIDLNVSNCYEILMLNNHKEVDFETWINTWLNFLFEFSGGNDSERLSTIENLVNKAIKCDPKVLEVILNQKKFTKLNGKIIPLRTRISAMWTVRKNGLHMQEEFEFILQRFYDELKLAILSHCDDTKIMALRLLVETHKSTESLTKDECDLILIYLKYNSNCQSPATREKSLGLFLKVLARFELNIAKIIKAENHKHFYWVFLKNLIRILVANLFPSANFSRRSISLHLLRECVSIVRKHGLSEEEFLSKNIEKVLFSSLNDSYEANKCLAISILKILNANTHCCFTELNINVIHEMMISIKPTESVTAAYYLEYYCQKLDQNERQFHFNSIHPATTTTTTSYNPVYFAAIQWCLTVLQNGLDEARISILLAAKKNPLYGVLFTVRHMIMKLDFQKLSLENEWRCLVNSLIMICKELTNVVSPVVNSSSPEGHLPNDFSEIPEYLGESEENDSNATTSIKVLSNRHILNKENSRTTPQMVLICAWRTVKEVSLILGEIVLKSPIQSKEKPNLYLVSVEQILQIGKHFKELLSETKHRGAFEQAYVGFSKLCTRLWRVDQSELHELPMKWLKELMEIISNVEKINEKICATRRSAGVPFTVQALITSELQVGTTKALNYCMKHLIDLILSKKSSSEARTHALNILRALFRCTDLNETVGEFVSDGIKCSIRAYEADTWSERNSSTLLFSALITRVFGVQRTKDTENLSIRNKMTGRIFFLRYPDLYDYFLNELKASSERIVQRKKADKLYPLLLVLSRLYPSALEGTETNLKLSDFVPFMSACSASPEMQTRILAAKAIVPLISPDRVNRRIFEVITFIKLLIRKEQDSNFIHGLFLQILYLIKSKRRLAINAGKSQEKLEIEFASSLSCELMEISSKICKNSVVLTTFLEIFIECLKRLKELPNHLAKEFAVFAQKLQLFAEHQKFILPKFEKTLLFYNLHILSLFKRPAAITQTLLSNLQLHPTRANREKIKATLNVFFLLLFQENPSEFIDIEEFEIFTIENDFVNSLNKDVIRDIQEELIKSPYLFQCLKNITKNRDLYYPEYTTKAYALLSQLDMDFLTETFDLLQFIKDSLNCHGELKASMALYIARIVSIQILDHRESEACLELLKNISQPWNSLSLRLTAIKLVEYMFEKFIAAIQSHNLKFSTEYTLITLRLLNDDDSDVRKHVTRLILNMLKNSKKLEISLDELPQDYIPVSSYAQKVFLQTIISEYMTTSTTDKSSEEFIVQFIVKIIEDHIDTNENYEEGGVDEFEVFDKNEANVFAESRTVVLDCLEILKSFSTSSCAAEVLCKFQHNSCS